MDGTQLLATATRSGVACVGVYRVCGVGLSPGGRRLLEPLEGQGVTSKFSSKIIRMRVQPATRGGGGVEGFSVLPIYPGLRI